MPPLDFEATSPLVVRGQQEEGFAISSLRFNSSFSFHCQQGNTGSVAQPFPTRCDPMDYSPPGTTADGILQTKILEWVTISSCRGSSRPRDQTYVSRISRQILYLCTPWEALSAKSSLLPFCLILRPVQKRNSCIKSCRTAHGPPCLAAAFEEPLLTQWLICVCSVIHAQH